MRPKAEESPPDFATMKSLRADLRRQKPRRDPSPRILRGSGLQTKKIPLNDVNEIPRPTSCRPRNDNPLM